MSKGNSKSKAKGIKSKGGSKSGGGSISERILKDAKLASEHLRMMMLIRRFEQHSVALYGMGLIGGFCHLYAGQEAVITGIKAALKPNDAIITSYRAHGAILASGTDPKVVMAELTGRADGVSKGKGGSMHIFDIERNFYGGHGIVGAQVSLGTGIAFSQLRLWGKKKDCGIAVTLFGEGALNQGQVHESFNMAALWGLPVLYVIENNRYAMGTSVQRSSARTNLVDSGKIFGIPGIEVTGQDILAVVDAAEKAREIIIKDKTPVIMEVNTYRYQGHSMSDPATYRTKQEVKDMRDKNDPIANFSKVLLKKKVIDEKQIKALEGGVNKEMKEVVEFAKSSPEPDISELYTDVLAS